MDNPTQKRQMGGQRSKEGAIGSWVISGEKISTYEVDVQGRMVSRQTPTVYMRRKLRDITICILYG